MCNLFANTMPQEAMRRLFEVAAADDRLGNAAPLPAIFPRHAAPVVRMAEGRRELAAMHWGFPMPQVSKRTGAPILPKAVNNARDDSLRSSPFWRGSFESRRCLIPATAFCEAKGMKPATHVWFGMARHADTGEGAAAEGERPPFAFAGLWRRWRGPYRGEEADIEAFAMVTTTPNALVATAHPDRMPAMLPPEDWAAWLTAAPEAAAALLRPFPAEAMRVVREGVGALADA